MDEEIEPIKQFENFTMTFYFPVDYIDSPANTEYVDVTFSRFKDAGLNTTIVSNTVTSVRTILPHDFGTEESPDVQDAFRFVISGSFGEELATDDEYVYRRGDEIINATSYGELPDFNEANTFIIKFFPDSRHSVNVSFEFTTNATPANTFSTGEQEFMLVPDRHVTRLVSIGETIQARAALERAAKSNDIKARINSVVPNYPGKQT
jgi:hypothetical protein